MVAEKYKIKSDEELSEKIDTREIRTQVDDSGRVTLLAVFHE